MSRMLKTFGLPYVSLPPELLDALSHDPAVVTGSTRHHKGWRAVDNIHEHILRQAETVDLFLQHLSSQSELPPPRSVLDTPLSILEQSLKILEQRKSALANKAYSVGDMLSRVKQLHSSVKTAYNATAAHTSSVYPEVRYSNPFTILVLTSLSSRKSWPWKRAIRTIISSCGNSVWTL